MNQRIAAINREDGRVAWVTELPGNGTIRSKQMDAITWFGPLLVSDRLAGGGHQQAGAGGQPRIPARSWERSRFRARHRLGPVVVGGTVFVVTDDGKLLALR